ncbi:MAG TPA: NAD(P)H-binding protein [Dokdonella sp.]|uniref:NAD(P)-dependent oxidoreductase n=1 Tax=Dokdonella sp. TaxID=2291710 RepID=UPI0025BF5B75|nr:NAD(P)H-binding protein [Dokdonella sp.]HNR91032.1 NAD(P)H-binding protein [Dokdonella sp.]
MRLFVLGASGGVGSSLLEQATARGHRVTAQTRDASKLSSTKSIRVVVGSPTDETFLRQHLGGHDAAVFCIGIGTIGQTTLFSDSTKALIAAMEATGTNRLVVITGIGAGDTKGHGGWFYNHVTYPLFTRNRYVDKDRQETILARTNLDWTIVRPAPFSVRSTTGPMQVFTEIPLGLQLRSVTRAEVATFILDILEDGKFIRQRPFIGHALSDPPSGDVSPAMMGFAPRPMHAAEGVGG